uniref:AlNc14C8G1075 protein n=1 Tax=Albugo laibachii Nc14 TaxID=890382 RepID=F0W1Z6_9STRA|nr:AlNc14C8G1075 [Albugo laibachii Nc14]|eukprot:CCA15075.1 AlNc14C8G1075 [Albugo laibachii Nc14]
MDWKAMEYGEIQWLFLICTPLKRIALVLADATGYFALIIGIRVFGIRTNCITVLQTIQFKSLSLRRMRFITYA